MENKQLYNIFSENGEVEKHNASSQEVIDYANAVFHYEMQDNDEEEIVSLQDAIDIFETNGQKVVPIYKNGGITAKENYEMVANQNRQIGHHSKELNSTLKGSKEVPAWVVAKVNRSATDLSDATHYLEGNKLMALGGNIDEYGANEFFNGLNLSAIPNDIADYIKNDIQSDKDLELISSDDETFVQLKNLIAKKYPKSLQDEEATQTSPSSDDNEDVSKYKKEIEDLEVLISIEDDSEMIKKYQKEIEDLNTLIELEN